MTQPVQPTPGISNDARAMMMFDANKKSVVVAYLLWLFLGGVGAHRFYSGKTGSGIAQLAMLIVGAALTAVGVGIVILIALGLWVLVDAFLIPGWISAQNSLLAAQLGGS